MIWLTNTHTHTKGKPTIALFKFQDICKTSFHHKAAYNSMFQEVFQRPCWSHCRGSERAKSLPPPAQPEKHTGTAPTGTTGKTLSFSKAATSAWVSSFHTSYAATLGQAHQTDLMHILRKIPLQHEAARLPLHFCQSAFYTPC